MAQDPYGLFVAPRDLRRQVDVLRRWGYRFATFSAFADLVRRGEADGWTTLTFDDGFADNLHNLLPVLQECRLPATVFAVSGWLGQTHPFAPQARVLDDRELCALHAAGVEIGGHTVTHPDLTTLPFDDARSELDRGRRELEDVLGAPVRVAAYPFGRAVAHTIAACAAAGFAAACRSSGMGSWTEPLNLPRQDMDNGCTLASLHLKRADRYEPLMRYRVARAGRYGIRLWRRVSR